MGYNTRNNTLNTNTNTSTNTDVVTDEQGAQGATGAQGRTGARGATGAQGETGPQGFPGKTGATGAQGTRGATGAQGAQGRTGMMGPAGTQGAQGAQGTQGIQGLQGSQGTQGTKGPQGVQGIQGNVGSTGMRGTAGPQGVRGCSGPQGSSGSAGVQGPQGRRGENGTQGYRGCAGPQGSRGVQGTAGPQGPKGYMGYRGPDGAAGVQGVEGKEGSVWYDGVRLDGYNTHLFHYDVDKGMFISPEGQNNYLELREGAFIRLWIDEAALEAIMAESEIRIIETKFGEWDDEQGEIPQFSRETEYKAYFGNELISTKLSEEVLNTVMEFTFHGNRWVYSGGSLGGDEPKISSTIKVVGVDAGDYHNGNTIPAGTLMEEVLRTMLTHTIDVHAVAPKLSLTVTVRDSNDDIIEGTNIEIGTPIKISVTTDFTDGKFVGDEGYDYEIDAGCELTGVEWTVNNVPVAGEEYTTIMESGTLRIQATAGYSESQAIPLKNTGVKSTAHIDEGSVLSSAVVISGVEYGYYGIVEKVTESSFDDPELYPIKNQSDLASKQKVILTNNEGYIAEMVSTPAQPSFVLAIPEGYRITQTFAGNEDVIGDDWDENHAGTWWKQNEIEYSVDERDLTYIVWTIPSSGATDYKKIKIGR